MTVLAVSLGEPAGIGPDIALLAYARRAAQPVPPFYVVGDLALLRRRAAALGLAVPLAATTPQAAAAAFAQALPVHDLALDLATAAGHPDTASARAAIAAIDIACGQVMAGEAAALVTNPISKADAYRAGFTAPGHTEYLATLAQRRGLEARAVMMLWAPTLAVVPVTIHIPLEKVASTLTSELIVATGRIVARDLASRFRIPHPRLAVSGLNPHAGEQGLLGAEEQRVIAPAIAHLRAGGLAVEGPFAADTLFHPKARARYDAALTMFHDQALIPIKTIAFDSAVNVTLGLPFVRTSPDHGTAFDIAGSGRADPTSFVAALALAARLSRP